MKQIEARHKAARLRVQQLIEDGQMEAYEDFQTDTWIAPGLELHKSSRTTWKYSPELNDKIKELQQYERQTDRATCQTTTFITVKVTDQD